MSKTDDKTIRITLSDNTHTELVILAMRKKIHVRELISDILDKYADKKKDINSN